MKGTFFVDAHNDRERPISLRVTTKFTPLSLEQALTLIDHLTTQVIKHDPRPQRDVRFLIECVDEPGAFVCVDDNGGVSYSSADIATIFEIGLHREFFNVATFPPVPEYVLSHPEKFQTRVVRSRKEIGRA